MAVVVNMGWERGALPAIRKGYQRVAPMSDSDSDEPFTDEEFNRRHPWVQAVAKEIAGMKDYEQVRAVYIRHGVDKSTAGQLAACHCGTFKGDRILIPDAA
jgi:hypothetical protein